jgi:outer membrane protein insertion porin family
MARLRTAAIRKGKKYSQPTLSSASKYLESTLASKDYLGATVKLVGANYDPTTNRADIIFHVQTGPPIHVKVEGAHLWSWTRHKLLPVYQQLGVDQELIQEGRQNLVSYFQSKGYFDTQVAADVTPSNPGESIVYRITKGPRHKVTGVEVAGNQSLSDKELLPHVTVEKGRFFSHGKYSDKLVRSSVKNLEGMYRAAGFSTVKVTPQVKNDAGNISVAFQVNEGPRDIVQALDLNGNTLPPNQLAPKGLKVAEGQPYSQKLVDEDRTQIMERYLNLGYLTATFHATAKPVSKQDPHHLVVTYQIYEGPQVTTASVVTLGRSQTRQSFIDRTAQLSAGRPMTENEMLTSESKLYTPAIFDWAEVDPRRQITTQNREDLIVKVHEAQRHQLIYGFGFEVINRGGSVPSGTVAVPGIPTHRTFKRFQDQRKNFLGTSRFDRVHDQKRSRTGRDDKFRRPGRTPGPARLVQLSGPALPRHRVGLKPYRLRRAQFREPDLQLERRPGRIPVATGSQRKRDEEPVYPLQLPRKHPERIADPGIDPPGRSPRAPFHSLDHLHTRHSRQRARRPQRHLPKL